MQADGLSSPDNVAAPSARKVRLPGAFAFTEFCAYAQNPMVCDVSYEYYSPVFWKMCTFSVFEILLKHYNEKARKTRS